MSMKKFVHVCLTPALIDQFDVSEAIVVVIDILRATTTMCVAFDHGAELMVPVEHIEECTPYKEKGFLIAGERSGEQLAGFDFGNSPFSYTEEAIKGKRIAITTTNGTRAIKAAQQRKRKRNRRWIFCKHQPADEMVDRARPTCLLAVCWLARQRHS